MGWQGLSVAASVLFRLVSYVFLRWIPGRFATYAIPGLFAVSAFFFFWPQSQAQPAIVHAPTPSTDAGSRATTPEPVSSTPSTPTRPVALVTRNGAAVDELTIGSPTYTPSFSSNTARKRAKKRQKELLLRAPIAPEVEDAEESFFGKLPKALGSLLFGYATRTRGLKAVNYTTLAVNALLLVAVLDLHWSPIIGMASLDTAFVRVGAVYPTKVRLVARLPPTAPSASVIEVEETSPTTEAKIVYRTVVPPGGRWISGPVLNTTGSEDADYVTSVDLEDLWADTTYEYRLLTTARGGGTHHPLVSSLSTFRTAPDPELSKSAGSKFTFVSTSCLKPGFPYEGPGSLRQIKGARLLRERVTKDAIRFMIFLGDFIYTDVPYYGGRELKTYQKRYRQVFSSPDFRSLLELLPWMGIFDDHELINDFSGRSDRRVLKGAIGAYQAYIGDGNPDPVVFPLDDAEAAAALEDEPADADSYPVQYSTYSYGDAAFFTWDTRLHRSSNAAPDDEHKTMLGARQKAAFIEWLREVNQTTTFKFVISSVPMMSLWALGSDTWAGFLTERQELLDIMRYVPNIIVLSGDRHEFAAASLADHAVTEFSTSPFQMFYLPIRTVAATNGRGKHGEDVLLKYLPDGNSKFTTFEVDTTVQLAPVVRVKVIIDGEEAWAVEVRGKPVRGLGAAGGKAAAGIGSLRKTLAELLAWTSRSWF